MNIFQRMMTAVSICVAAAGWNISAEAGTLKLANTTWVGWGPLYLARDLGYYKDMGLDLQMPTTNETREGFLALAAGEADGVPDTVDDLLVYRTPDTCFKIVLALDDSYGGDGVLVTPDITDLTQIKGKTVAVNQDSVSSFWLHYLMKEKGMKSSDISVANMTADEAAAAFIAGKVPVAVTWEPNLTFATSKGNGKVLIDSKSTPGMIVDVITLSCKVIEQQPNDVKALVKGYYKALDYMKANPDDSNKIMAKGIGGWLSKPEDVAATLHHVRFMDKAQNAEYLGTAEKPGKIAETIELGNEIWGELGRVKNQTPAKDLIDWSFHQE